MRASTSLTSFLSSLRSPSLSSHMLIPIIYIISPTESASPRPSQGHSVIRRWRGARGTLGDFTLQLPSQGLTSGARLALARQGCATGSFRLNCSESLYVKDERGLAMFERIELEEELEKAGLGLRERPPMLSTSFSKSTDLSTDIDTESSSEVADQSIQKRRPSLRTQRKNMLALQNMRFDSGGLSSCVTFSEGLCNLEDYVRASDSESAISDMPTVHSEEEISHLTSVGETCKISWLDSLRKKTLASAVKFASIRSRRSASELVQPIADLEMSFSEADLTLHVDSSSSSSDDSSHIMEDSPKNASYQVGEDEDLDALSLGMLQREGSWTRLRRRLSKRLSMRSLSVKNLDLTVQDASLDGSISIASGLFRFIQQGIPTTFIQSSMHVYS